MENPNEYNDERYTYGTVELSHAIQTMWNAGASEENIATELTNACENIGIDPTAICEHV